MLTPHQGATKATRLVLYLRGWTCWFHDRLADLRTFAFRAFLNDLGSSILTWELGGKIAPNANEGARASANSGRDNFIVNQGSSSWINIPQNDFTFYVLLIHVTRTRESFHHTYLYLPTARHNIWTKQLGNRTISITTGIKYDWILFCPILPVYLCSNWTPLRPTSSGCVSPRVQIHRHNGSRSRISCVIAGFLCLCSRLPSQ